MGQLSQSHAASKTATGLEPVRRALLSVSDKTGIDGFARALVSRGVEILSTGGTARALREHGIEVIDIAEVTGLPEMMDGRVKTLHPAIHGGVLGRRDTDAEVMRANDIKPIDLVCINLYPFEQTIAAGATDDEAIEQIDIGGPALIRSAAKNHRWVTVVIGQDQYDEVVEELGRHDGSTSLELRRSLAARAFARTSAYDHAICHCLAGSNEDQDAQLPAALCLSLPGVMTLRYGENPHQQAALYAEPMSQGPSIVGAEQLHGKALSYNNINDASAALSLTEDLSELHMWSYSASVVKHANPCGSAVASSAREAILAALAGDPMAAYGGILAIDGVIDDSVAQALCTDGQFLEVIVAEAFEPDALDRLRTRWKHVRLLAVGEIGRANTSLGAPQLRSVAGGVLAQTSDDKRADSSSWEHRAGPRPSEQRLRDATVIWTACKHLSSNAVVIGACEQGGGTIRMYGAGAGQMDRLTACRLAVEKTGEAPHDAIAASDGFFPFADGPEVLMQAGVTLIVHPGGSKRDDNTFKLCEKMGVTCMTTGVRHFRH